MRNLLGIAAAALLFAGSALSLGATDFFARDFGARPDGVTLNTASIQAAIDFASSRGGGRVVLDKGDYISGSIYLKNNVTLHIEKDAALVGSLNPYDYVKDPDAKWTALILAVKQENIGLTGEGVVDGRGFDVGVRFVDFVHMGLIDDKLGNDRVNETIRPENIHMYLCNNVTIKDITLKDPACWTQQYDKCRNLLIDGVTVDAKCYWNNDGLDVVDCSDVIVRNCYID